jgi:hypothetical protein
VHRRVDLVLVLPADGQLKLVPRSRQVHGAAERDERLGERKRDAPPDSLRLDLRLLPQPFGVEERRDEQRDEEDEDAARGRCRRDLHQKRK